MLISGQWQRLVLGGFVKALHVWGSFMGCDMESLYKLKPCTSSAEKGATASHSFLI